MVSWFAMDTELNRLLNELEQSIDKLKIQYERYFMGLERFEPLKQRRAVTRAIRYLRSQVIGNTAQKFRFRMLLQRFTTYQSHWNRVQRQIEEGTYRRDLARMQRDLKKRGVDAPDLMKARNAGEVEAALMKYMNAVKQKERQAAAEVPEPASSPSASTSPAAEKRSKTPSASPPPLPPEVTGDRPSRSRKHAAASSDPRLRRVYEAFLEARRRTGETTKGLTFDKMVKSIHKQLPKIQKQHGSREVEFSVEVKNGKAVLKAAPKK
jgi:hypothetical protein